MVRVTIEMPDDLHKQVKEIAHQGKLTVKDWYVQAIKDSLDPPLSFWVPAPEEYALDEFLGDAKEIILVGPILDSLTDMVGERERYDEFFERKILQEHTPVTVIMVHPGLRQDDPVIQILEKRHGHKFPGEPGKRILNRLDGVAQYLNKLRRWGAESKTRVRVLYTRKLPMCGLAVADPWSPDAKMSVALYLHNAIGVRDPFFVVLKRDRTAQIYDTIMKHFVSLSQDTECAPEMEGEL